MPTYTKVALFGEQTCDYITIENGIRTQDEIDATLTYDYEPQWNNNTLLLADFNDGNINASNISLSGLLTGWQIYREEVGSNTLKLVKKVDVETTLVKDYVVKNNTIYKYHVFPETTTTLGNRLESDNITINFWNWSLTELIPTDEDDIYTVGNVFLFDLDLVSSEIQNITDTRQYDGYLQYSKIAKGQRDYLQGSISALLGSINSNGNYEDSVVLREQLQACVNNSYKKLLKSRKGDLLLVQTNNFRFKNRDVLVEQPLDISFDWIEIGSANNISVTD